MWFLGIYDEGCTSLGERRKQNGLTDKIDIYRTNPIKQKRINARFFSISRMIIPYCQSRELVK